MVRRKHKWAATIAVLGLLAGGTVAAPVAQAAGEWSAPTTLSPSASTTVRAPSIVVSADGQKVVATWVRRITATTGVIQAARSTDGGATWTPAVNITGTSQDVDQPQIVAASDLSKAIVFWLVRDAGTNYIKNSTSPDGGVTWPSASTVTSGMSDLGSYDAAASADATRVHVTWQAPAAGSYRIIQTRSSANSGGTWGTTQTVSLASDVNSSPVVTTGNDGLRATIAWNHKPDVGSQTVVASSTTNGGSVWSGPQKLTANGSSTAFQPQLATSATGGSLAATWEQWDADTKRIVRVATSQNAGTSWSDPEAISVDGVDTNGPRVLSATDGGRLVVVWGSTQGVRARTRATAADPWGPIVALSTNGDQVRVAGSTDGMTLVAMWRTTPTYSIAAATSVDGGATWTPSSGLVAVGGETPQVAAAADGRTFSAVWSLKQGTSYLTQAARGPSLTPDADVSPAALDFGTLSVGTTADRSVTVTNTGLGSLTVSGAALTGSDRFSLAQNTCDSPIAPGGSCQITVRLTPAAAGAINGTLQLTDNTAAGSRAVTLAGTGADVPAKQTQSPLNSRGLPPKAIKKKGITVVTGRNARTNAGQPITTVVKVKAKKGQYRVVRGKQGKVSIRTFGTKLKRVTITQRAPETASHLPYSRTSTYRKGKRV